MHADDSQTSRLKEVLEQQQKDRAPEEKLATETNPLNRKMRRASEVISSRQPPPDPSPSRLLHQRVSSVEQEQERLAKVVDQNSEAFSDGLKMLEAMSLVLQRVMNEVIKGEVVHSHSDGSINFQEYLREYWLCMLMADFAAWCRTLQPEQQLIVAPSNDEVHVFGGD